MLVTGTSVFDPALLKLLYNVESGGSTVAVVTSETSQSQTASDCPCLEKSLWPTPGQASV